MRIKRELFCLWFFILLFNVLNAQVKNGVNSVLWKVQSLGSSHTSYLLGTIHIFGNEWVDSFPLLDSLIHSSSTFIIESMPNKGTLAISDWPNDLANEKRTAREFFGKDFDLVNNFILKETGVSITVMDTSKLPKVPVLYAFGIFLMNTLAEKHNLKVGTDMQLVDNILFEKADSAKKVCIGLDNRSNIKDVYTSEKFISEITTGIVETVKMISGEETKKMNTMLLEMKSYEQGVYVYRFNAFARGYPVGLLKQRNIDWMKQLPNLIKSKDCFIAVGIAHLDFRKGLVRELSRQGFILTPIKLVTINN